MYMPETFGRGGSDRVIVNESVPTLRTSTDAEVRYARP